MIRSKISDGVRNINCKICGENTIKIHHEKMKIDYFNCYNCQFIFKDDKYILSPEEEIKRYNTHNNSINDPKYVEYFYKFLNNALFPFVEKGKKGLDFGSGPSPVLAEILKRNHDFDMDIYDLYYSPEKIYVGKTYDFITTTEVIEHLESPMDYFKLFNKLLNDDGILCVMTLLHPKDIQKFINWHYIRDKSHISFFTLETMEYIGEKTGFEIIYSDNTRYITFKKIKRGK